MEKWEAVPSDEKHELVKCLLPKVLYYIYIYIHMFMYVDRRMELIEKWHPKHTFFPTKKAISMFCLPICYPAYIRKPTATKPKCIYVAPVFLATNKSAFSMKAYLLHQGVCYLSSFLLLSCSTMKYSWACYILSYKQLYATKF